MLGDRSRGVVALVVAGTLFGSTFLVVQGAIDDVAVAPFLAVRFLVAAAVLWPVARRRPASTGEIRHGALAGVCLLAAFSLQTVGLRSTGAATSAFITYLLVVLVPVMVAVRTRRRPTGAVVVGVVIAVAGLAELTGAGDTSGSGLLGGFGWGEALTALSAVGFALHLVILGSLSTRHDPVRLTLWQVLTVGVACVVPGLVSPGGLRLGISPLVAAVFCGVGATAVAFFLMAWGQRRVPETQAALILLLEPVSAAILAELAGEHLGGRGLLGAALILVAVVIAELGDRHRPAPATELAVPEPTS